MTCCIYVAVNKRNYRTHSDGARPLGATGLKLLVHALSVGYDDVARVLVAYHQALSQLGQIQRGQQADTGIQTDLIVPSWRCDSERVVSSTFG